MARAARPSSLQRVAIGTLMALLIGALATRYFRQDIQFARQHQATLDLAEVMYVPPAQVLRVLSLGHQSFMADLLYIRGFAYFIEHLFGDRRYEWFDTYVHTVLELDPYVRSIYRWASQNVKLGQTIDRAVIEKSNYYAQRGLEVFPDDWRLYMDIGFNYYYEWKPESDEERARVRALAREYFSIAATLPGSELSPNFVTALFIQNDDKELALFHAYSRYLDASDRERAELLTRIQDIENEEAVEALRKRDAQWKEHFPFVPRPFFELLGEPSSRRLPSTWDELERLYQFTSDLDAYADAAQRSSE